jgi:CysZ protein
MARPSIFGRFFGAISAAATGAAMLATRPRLWGWLLAPLIANLLVVVTLGSLLLALIVKLSKSFSPHFAGADGRQSWWGWSLEWFLFLVGVGLALLLLIIVWKVLELILFGIAYARITEAVQRERLRPGATLRPLSMMQDFLDAIFNVFILLSGFAIIFLLNFLPGVGSVLSLVLGVLWGASIQGLDLMGVCRALRGERRWRQIAFCYRNGAETLGLGLVGFIFSFLPILGPLLVASCAVCSVLVNEEITRREGIT